MPRSLSATATEAVLAPQTGQLFATLVTITDGVTAFRLCDSGAEIVVGGETFQPFPFQVDLPEEVPNTPPTVRAIVCNVDRSIIPFLRGITAPCTFEVMVVLASSPNTIEWGPFEFTLRGFSYTAETIQMELGLEDFVNEPYPADKITPITFPGVFQ